MTSRLWNCTGASIDVERFAAGGLAGAIERDLFDPRFRLPQQFLAAFLESLAALVDRYRLLERHLAFLQPLDDRFQFFDRPLEGHFLHVGIAGLGHFLFPARYVAASYAVMG